MPKRIVFCADGTWDTEQNKTNVYRLFQALPISAAQVAYYDEGVGSDGTPISRLLGGAFGDGLFQKIKDGYSKIAHTYEAGDDIFLFGFSRGAYTARSLAGMIAVCGLPTQNFDDTLVDTAFQAYRDKTRRAALLSSLGKYGLFDAQIRMIGVWDTVGALGLPALVGKVDPSVFGFLDTGLHPDVKNAYHALSIDERRPEFPPTLWSSPLQTDQMMEQVWFAGVHCDVGGGYAETGLSNITFSWMLGKAKALGLEIADSVWSAYGNIESKYALDTLHESWSPLWGFPRVRRIENTAALSSSVAVRCQNDCSYTPGNIASRDGCLSGTYQVVPTVA